MPGWGAWHVLQRWAAAAAGCGIETWDGSAAHRHCLLTLVQLLTCKSNLCGPPRRLCLLEHLTPAAH